MRGKITHNGRILSRDTVSQKSVWRGQRVCSRSCGGLPGFYWLMTGCRKWRKQLHLCEYCINPEELPLLLANDRNASEKCVWWVHHSSYVDGWRRSLTPLASRSSRHFHELTLVTSAMRPSRKIRRVKGRLDGLAFYWMSVAETNRVLDVERCGVVLADQ